MTDSLQDIVSEITFEDAKFIAEAAAFEATVVAMAAEAELNRLKAEEIALTLEQMDRKFEFALASDIENRVFRFDDEVTQKSCAECYAFLSRWARLDIDKPVEIQLTTGGGDVWHGMALVDQMLALRKQGLHIKVTVRGTAASMGAIILQAGSERVMGPSSTILMHKLSTDLHGTLDQLDDITKWLKLVQDQANKLVAERSSLTLKQIAAGMSRQDWSFDPEAALAAGLIDSIG